MGMGDETREPDRAVALERAHLGFDFAAEQAPDTVAPRRRRRRDAVQVFRASDLARRMRLEGEYGVFARHPFAIVGDGDSAATPLIDLDDDPPRAGIERVLDELLDDGRGPLDHLAGRDLAGDG